MPDQINVQCRNEHLAWVESEKLEIPVVALDCSLESSLQRWTSDPEVGIHFLDKDTLALDVINKPLDCL